MKISSCSLALLSFVIFSIKNHDAFPCTNRSSSTTLQDILTYFYYPFTDRSTISTSRKTPLIYDPYTDEPTTATSQRTPLIYDPYTDKPTTATSRRTPLIYDPYTDKPTTSTSRNTTLTYDPYTNKSTISSTRRETLIYNPFAEKSTTTRLTELQKYTYAPFTVKFTTWSPPTPIQKHRNRYNVRHRFRNPIVTVSPPSLTTSFRASQKPLNSEMRTIPNFKLDDMYKSLKDYAFIKTPLGSTPMVHLNITVPRVLLEGKVPRLASPYIIKITLARRLAPRSNTTLPNRGFLRIVGSPVNMFQEGNLGMLLGKIASQIGNAYNMTGKDVQGMRHVIVVGPGGNMMNRRATPPKKTTKLTSPPMMTARVRLRPNSTLPKITDQVIYFEDYLKYFELY